jgi:hypothetical protein
MLVYNFKIGHDLFPSYSFQLVIHESSYHSTLFITRVRESSFIKLIHQSANKKSCIADVSVPVNRFKYRVYFEVAYSSRLMWQWKLYFYTRFSPCRSNFGEIKLENEWTINYERIKGKEIEIMIKIMLRIWRQLTLYAELRLLLHLSWNSVSTVHIFMHFWLYSYYCFVTFAGINFNGFQWAHPIVR